MGSDGVRTPWGFASHQWPETWQSGGYSREDAIAAGKDFYGGRPFWVVEGRQATADDYAKFAAEAAIDSIREQAGNEAGEAAEDYVPTLEAEKELDGLIHEWARKYMVPTFWVADGDPEQITGDDNV